MNQSLKDVSLNAFLNPWILLLRLNNKYDTLNGNIYATRQHRAPEMWLKRTEMAGHATQTFVPLDEEEIINEIILMGLRTKAGVDASNFYLRTGRNLKEAVNVEA